MLRSVLTVLLVVTASPVVCIEDLGSTGDIECVCEGSSCGGVQRCFGRQCFSSLSVQNRTALQQKGCIVGSDEETGRCGSASAVQCCQGTLCNMNVTVEMPSTEESQSCTSGMA